MSFVAGSLSMAPPADPAVKARETSFVATSNPLQNRLVQDASMFDPVEAPALRYAFELVNAAILEADSRLRHQVLSLIHI